jgi:hypothetical protein
MKMISVDTLWYRLLGLMQELGIHVQRETFKKKIKKICDDFGIRRDSIGLVTGARAALYFNGGWESVSFDAIEELSGKGTDVVFIEKEGIIEELKEFADKYGVAMVNSRGYLTEYAQDLMRLANAAGGNVIIISDYDLSGINLSSKCPKNITWITMDDDTLDYFGIKKTLASGEYDPAIVVDATHKDLINSVTELKETDPRFANLDIDFLMTSRIEINAIIAQVGDERFWEFIMHRLKELFPKRNYNRAIELPTKDTDIDEIDLYPNGIRSLMLRVRKVRDAAVAKKEKEIESSMENVDGFLDVSEKKKENKASVKKAVIENKDIKKLEAEAVKVCNKMRIDIEDPDEDDATEAEEG